MPETIAAAFFLPVRYIPASVRKAEAERRILHELRA